MNKIFKYAVFLVFICNVTLSLRSVSIGQIIGAMVPFQSVSSMKFNLVLMPIIFGCGVFYKNIVDAVDAKTAAQVLANRSLYIKAFDALNNKYSAAAIIGVSACAGLGYWAIQSRKAKQQLSA